MLVGIVSIISVNYVLRVLLFFVIDSIGNAQLKIIHVIDHSFFNGRNGSDASADNPSVSLSDLPRLESFTTGVSSFLFIKSLKLRSSHAVNY